VHNISQAVILRKFANLIAKSPMPAELRHEIPLVATANSGENIGHCAGFTAIFLFSIWLYYQQDITPNAPRDDAQWFYNMLLIIAQTDVETITENKEIERFFGQLTYYQHANLYLECPVTALDKTIFSTSSVAPQKEYSLCGLFYREDFVRSLDFSSAETTYTGTLLDLIIKENRLITIETANHATGLFLFNDAFHYYDSNNPEGHITFHKSETSKLADAILNAHHHIEGKNLLLGFNIFRMNDQASLYPDRYDLLAELFQDYRIADEGELTHPLELAARMECEELIELYLCSKGYLPVSGLPKTKMTTLIERSKDPIKHLLVESEAAREQATADFYNYLNSIDASPPGSPDPIYSNTPPPSTPLFFPLDSSLEESDTDTETSERAAKRSRRTLQA
jgi:hypothetical protein